MKFQIIVCDAPWSPVDKLKMSKVKRGAEANYDGTLSVAELCELDVNNICDPRGTVLCLWVLNSMLEEGLQVMKAWGFKQKQVFTWVKGSYKKKSKKKDAELVLGFGMGRMFRASTEMCLIGIKGKNVYKSLMNKAQRNVSLDPNIGHSSKPETLQDRLELMWPDTSKVEMFARRKRANWACAGNELQIGEDITVSLKNLASDTYLWKYDDNYIVLSEDSSNNEDNIQSVEEPNS